MIPVVEIFKTVQGEGPLIGKPTVFVRSGGCDYRCSWCDSMYAVLANKYGHEWTSMGPEEIWSKVTELASVPITITLSGGNPALHDFSKFVELANRNNYPVVIETQGSVFKEWMRALSLVILSPKPPSSGHVTPIKKVVLHERELYPRVAYKVVVFDDDDFDYAVEVYKNRANPYSEFYFQTGNNQYENDKVSLASLAEKQRWLTKRVLDAGIYDVSVLPQMHVWLYGNERGV